VLKLNVSGKCQINAMILTGIMKIPLNRGFFCPSGCEVEPPDLENILAGDIGDLQRDAGIGPFRYDHPFRQHDRGQRSANVPPETRLGNGRGPIYHSLKITLVSAFGDDDGRDTELGLDAENVPPSRPFVLRAEKIFKGVAKHSGLPVPDAVIEVEHHNR
jgi:hypothetical protein